jgi:tRNA(fMet)-specific endonuclease VapC
MPSVYILDTNAVSAVMADHPKVKARLAQQPGRVMTCAIVRGEVRYGLERLPLGKRRSNIEAKANAVFATLPIEPVAQGAADIYGTTRRGLEQQGYILSDNDLWIAAVALSLGAVLVSNDQGFTHISGLIVEDWTL